MNLFLKKKWNSNSKHLKKLWPRPEKAVMKKMWNQERGSQDLYRNAVGHIKNFDNDDPQVPQYFGHNFFYG